MTSIKFSERFGLPKDRQKLTADWSDFDIVKVEIVQSKKMYDVRTETESGTVVKKKKIDIAYIDVHLYEDGKPSKEITKFYAPNAPIAAACKDILESYGKPDGTLKEPIYIAEVKEEKGENKNSYLFFT
jgi:hypothetical protein